MVIRIVYVDYLCNILFLVSMEDDFIQCRACNGEGIDLDGFVCWKCKGEGQITHLSTSKDSTDTNINKSTR
jgi:DnaJ-class molecular chaperone